MAFKHSQGSCLGDTEVTIEGEGLGTLCSEVLVGDVPVDVGYYVKTNCLKFRFLILTRE